MSADNHTGFGYGYEWPGYPSDSWVSTPDEAPDEPSSLNGSVATMTVNTRGRKFSLLSYTSTNRTTNTRDYGFTTATPKRVQLVLAGILVCLITIAVILAWGSGLAEGAVIHEFKRELPGLANPLPERSIGGLPKNYTAKKAPRRSKHSTQGWATSTKAPTKRA